MHFPQLGNKEIIEIIPHTPGIDAAGIVEFSETDKYKRGDSNRNWL